MTAKMAEAIKSGKAYAAYVRTVLSDGRVIFKPATKEFKRDGDGAVLRAAAFITPEELGEATVVRTGLSCEDGGAEVTGGDCAQTQSGGLGVTVSCTVRADISGLVGDRLARIITGADALCPLSVRAELIDGGAEICGCVTEISENGFTLKVSVPASARVLTIIADGEDSLVLSLPLATERVTFETVNTSVEAEFWTERDLASLETVTSEGKTVNFTSKNLPVRISSVAEKLPECYNGRLSAFGEYLAVRSENAIRVFRRGELVTERAAKGIVSEWVSDDGMLAYCENGRVRLGKGAEDYFVKEVSADYVAVTGSGAEAVVHCLDSENGVCVGYDVQGVKKYDRVCEDLAIGVSNGKVMAVGRRNIFIYSPTGALLIKNDLNYIVRKVYRCMPDILLVEAGPESVSTKMIVSLKAAYVLDENAEVTDACDRLFCVRDERGYRLCVFRETDAQTIGYVRGGEPALVADTLYIHGEEGTYLYRPLECGTIAYSYDLFHNSVLTCEAYRYVVGTDNKEISVNINVEEY